MQKQYFNKILQLHFYCLSTAFPPHIKDFGGFLLFYFQRLDVYHLAKKMALSCYRVTKEFPSEERFGLTSQLRCAAVSVSANIAEGIARRGKKDKTHFLNIAYASLMEEVCLLDITQDLDYLKKDQSEAIQKEAKNLAVKLSNLAAYIEKS